MAREFVDGFESGSTQLWDFVSGAMNITGALTNAVGSYSVYQYNGDTQYMEKYLTARDYYYVAFKFKRGNLANSPVIKFLNGTTVLGSLYLINSGTVGYLEARKGDNSTLLGTGTTNFAVATTAQIEIYYLPKTDTTGSFIVKVNGLVEINATSVSTSPSALQINRIRIGQSRQNAAYDDVIVDSADWIGSTYIVGLVPNGAGSTTEMDPSTGANYTCVDERGPSDTDYVSTNVTNEIDTYAMADLGVSGVTIKSVSAHVRGLYEGAPTPTKIAPVVRSGGTNYVGTALTLATTAKASATIWETNPNTSSAWSVSDVNGLEAGTKAVA